MSQVDEKNTLQKIVEKLKLKGEDADELDFWLEIFDLLDESQRKQLLENLTQELDSLNAIK